MSVQSKKTALTAHARAHNIASGKGEIHRLPALTVITHAVGFRFTQLNSIVWRMMGWGTSYRVNTSYFQRTASILIVDVTIVVKQVATVCHGFSYRAHIKQVFVDKLKHANVLQLQGRLADRWIVMLKSLMEDSAKVLSGLMANLQILYLL